jgi:hypothetical protein
MSIPVSVLICHSRHLTPDQGTAPGTCCICGSYTDHGYEWTDTGTFTTFQFILGGDVVCPACWHIKKSRDYRCSMWWVNEKEFRQFKFEEARYALQNPPEPPFAIYFTRTWKKQGWINLVNRANHSKDRFVVGFDYDVIEVDACKRDQHFQFIDDLFQQGLRKTEILAGIVQPRSCEKIDRETHERLQELRGDPLWDLCAWVTPAPKKEVKNGSI